MKKNVVKILIFIIIFNFIFSQFGSIFAITKMTPGSSVSGSGKAGQDNIEEAIKEGNNEGTTPDPSGGTSPVDRANTTSTASAIGGILASVVDTIPMLFSMTLNSIVSQGGMTESGFDTSYLTVENIVFQRYYMMDVNMFRKIQAGDLYYADTSTVDILNSIKDSIARWYYICRLIAMALGLITLIYIGIRMAISTVASQQAKYKKMLIGWVQSIVIIALLPYLMSIFYFLVQTLMNILNELRNSMGATSIAKSFEITIMDSTFENFRETGGWTLVAYSIMFWVMVWMQFKFFVMYIKRVFAVGFLVIISPLITITYSMDKAGDGRAQAFEAWLREFVVNVTIPILQSAIYLVFAFSADEIAKEAPIVGFIFLFSLTRAEKIVKTIFNLKGLVSIRSMRLFKKGE